MSGYFSFLRNASPRRRLGPSLQDHCWVRALPPVHDQELYEEKVERIYQHVYNAYWGEGASVYEAA